MNQGLKNILFILVVFIILTLYTVLTFIGESMKSVTIQIPDFSNNAFLINTDGCKIPLMNPYDPVIKHYLDKGGDLKCAVTTDLVYAENEIIYINWTEVNRSNSAIKYCKYDVIWRPPYEEKDHNFHTFINESEIFYDSIEVSEDYVRVQCFDKNNSTVYTNAFSFVQSKPETEQTFLKNRQKYSKSKSEELSILMLGVDSVSRSNMVRYMPETRSYLLQNMSAFELIGYNKIDDNTFVNIVPMTTGKFVKELPWKEDMTGQPFDKYDFIWKNYSQHGYKTLYVEDAPDIQIFDYAKAGFAKAPADYFNRPFSVAAERMSGIWNTGHHCIHARPESGIMLDFLKQFVYKFKSSPYFAFTFLTRLTHDSLSATKQADSLYFNFLKEINNNDILNKTILFFFSDHGIRFGKVRETSVGKLEERLPFMFVIFPRWFLNKYPDIRTNLQINTKRLTTPFDIYQTLHYLLEFQRLPQKNLKSTSRGLNILNEITPDRTCEHAAILPHWCTCSQYQVIPITDSVVVNISKQFVDKINIELKNYSQCEVLHLEEVKYASQLVTSDKVLKFERKLSDVNNFLVKYGKRVNSYVDYQLTILTSPGGALFEGTLRLDEGSKSVEMLGDISRINMYGTQSHCVDVTNVKKFCYCKHQI